MNNFFSWLKKLLVVFLSFVIAIFLSAQAYAYEVYGPKMIGGVGQSGNYTRCYWYNTNSVPSEWQNRIDNSMNAWCNTGTNGCGIYTSVWFTRSTVKSNSVVDFYTTNDLPIGVFAITSFFTGTGTNSAQIYPYDDLKNWVWAKIEICNGYSDGFLTSTQRLALVEHEIGHAFGLDHTTNPKVLMHPFADECVASRPTKDDCKGVNSIYGGYNP